ncbi:FMN-linked oxidoreductase [Annulohypoxylon truncatum]|uniref:FMN-linked oxidoreductase n=1 Tax=Annulohypoxylon truncatum TaxID=327061 RepID=UPI0020088B3E|nr:FMN-linked oxidoreductase [Annulohypoxylon truncatum]KAI1213967.1 FMN-linked oxidoreductase [Annulohypoxylon truncatum]
MASVRSQSKLFQPLAIADGKITLKHRIVLAPLTRNRGTPYSESTPEKPNRIWVPNNLMVDYYSQRATDGGLLISEAIPPSLEGNATPGVPGLFIPEQAEGWKKVVDAVHAKGGYMYAQLWHAGRANIPQLTAYPPPHSTTPVKFVDYPPIEMTVSKIKSTIQDYCNAARLALKAGFDGIEIHGANGYLPEQFLSSNINHRTDEYGGTPEKRCKFVLELMGELAKVVGQENLSIRLSPFGLFNQTRSTQRLETWSHLCREIKANHPKLSYVSFIEPRFELIYTEAEKQKFLDSWGLPDISLEPFRKIFGETPLFSGGGWNDKNSWGVLESGAYDALVYGRYFISNPDLVEKLRRGLPLSHYDRSTFYGPLEDNSVGYTDYPVYEKGLPN